MVDNIESPNRLSFELKGQSSLIQIVFYVILLALLFCFCIGQIIETNKTIYLSCNKSKNICIFGEYKLFKGMRYLNIEYSAVKDAYIHTNHEKGGNTYDFIIPTTKGKFYLYKGAYGVDYLLNLQQTFNNYKNYSVQNLFTINQHNSFFLMFPTFCLFFILLGEYAFLFGTGYKQSITIDKDNDSISTKIYRLVGIKTINLKMSKIKQIYLKKSITTKKSELVIMKCLLNDDRKLRVLSYPIDKEFLTPIYNQINEFIFGDLNKNTDSDIVTDDIRDVMLPKYDLKDVQAKENIPLFTTKSPIIMGVLAFITSFYIAAVLGIGFHVHFATIELFIVPIAVLYAFIVGWRLQAKLPVAYCLKFTLSTILPFLLFGFFQFHKSSTATSNTYLGLFYMSTLFSFAIYFFSSIVSKTSAKSIIPPDVIPLDIKIKKRIICGISLVFIFLSLLARVLTNAEIISIDDNIILSLTFGIPFAIFIFFQCLVKYSWMNYLPPSENNVETIDVTKQENNLEI